MHRPTIQAGFTLIEIMVVVFILGLLVTLVAPRIIGRTDVPSGLSVTMRGMVQGMRASFNSFAIGLTLAVVLLFLILVAQFQSFLDPFIILIAVPPGLTGVIVMLWLTNTTLNVTVLVPTEKSTSVAAAAAAKTLVLVKLAPGTKPEISRSNGDG